MFRVGLGLGFVSGFWELCFGESFCFFDWSQLMFVVI